MTYSTHTARTKTILCLALTGLLVLPAMALADEIWLEPAKQDANSKVGNWGTANLGGFLSYAKETHFAFHVPDNFVSFTQAIVVLIPSSTSTLDYRAKSNVARDGESHTTNPGSFSGSQAVTKDQLTEVDVSTIIPALIPSDYVTVNFEMGGSFEKTRVVGMRFVYEGAGASVAGTSCPAGQVLTGYNADGEPLCVDDMHVKGTGCPAGQVVTGYDANGNVQCAVDQDTDTDTRAQGSCSGGQVVSAINADGTVTCVVDADMHVKGTSCPAGEVLTGYDANGTPQCVAQIEDLSNSHNPCTDGGTDGGTRWTVSFSGLTVCDKDHGYTWQQHPTSTLRNWDDSIAYCQNLVVGGDDWALPERDVLETLVDTNSTGCTDAFAVTPCLPDDHSFDNEQSADYWSATEAGSNSAYLVFFGNGEVGLQGKDATFHAWCVRGG